MGRVLPAGARSALSDLAGRSRELASTACLSRWTIAHLHGSPVDVVYVGRAAFRDAACDLVTRSATVDRGAAAAVVALASENVPVVSDAPLPRAVRVASMVRAVLPLTSSGFALKARQRAQAAEYQVLDVEDDAAVERVHREMLEPFARARHGDRAVVMPLAAVKRITRMGGLFVLAHGATKVAAHLWYACTRGGKRYWVCCRAGYAESTFSDPRRLADAHLVNSWVGFQRAKRLGFDGYDLGAASARPDDGILQWKRLRGGHLDAWGMHHRVWIRPPRAALAAFFWGSPLLGLERRGIVLRIGAPEAVTPSVLMERFGRFRFGGLAAVRLHVDPAHHAIVDEVRRRFGSVPVEVVRES